MTLCVCDGPPHTYDPAWCGVRKPAGEMPMRAAAPLGADTLRSPYAQRAASHRARGQETLARTIEWMERLESDAHWARGPQERADALEKIEILRDLLRMIGVGP